MAVKYEIESSVEPDMTVVRARLWVDSSNELRVEFQAPNGNWSCVVWFAKNGELYRAYGAQDIPGLTADTTGRIKCC